MSKGDLQNKILIGFWGKQINMVKPKHTTIYSISINILRFMIILPYY